MEKALELLLANGLTEKGLNWNQKVYGNSIYLNGEKVVLYGDVLELAKRRFNISTHGVSVDVRNNLGYCEIQKIPFTCEDTSGCVKKLLLEAKLDIESNDSIKEIEETIAARKAEAFNTLVNGINGLLTNEGKKAKFEALCAFVMA